MPRLEVIRGDEPESWRHRVVDWVSRSLHLGPYNTKDPALARLFGGPPTATGVSVTEQTALGVSAFWCAITTIAADVSSLPLVLYKRLPNGGKERYEGHPLYRLLHDSPNPEMTSMQCRETLLLSALLGNAYAEIVRDSAGRATELWPIDAHRVTPFREGGALRYRVTGGDRDVIFTPRDLIHLRGPSPDGILGHDIVRIAREALGLSIAAERFGGTFFGNGSSFGGLLTTPLPLAPAVRNNLERSIEARHQGVDRAHRFLLLEGGLTYQQLGVNPRDSQFNELRAHQIREIARFFKIPVALLGDLERSTFSNHEQQTLTYYTNCLRPWLVRIEQEFMTKLISPLERNQQVIEHVTEGFLRGAHTERAQFYATMLSHGAMTVNEVRARENLPPIAGGDTARVPMNTEELAS